jgi:hypothetical protein
MAHDGLACEACRGAIRLDKSRAMNVLRTVNAAPLWGGDAQVRLEVKLSAGKPFDDQHDCRAGWATRQGRCFGALCRCNCTERLAAALERSTASSVCEEAEVADTNQAFGQNVKKKSAQELICRNGHDFVLGAVSIVSPAEGDAIVLESHESMVGDSYAMSVAGQIVENVFGAAEGRLGIDHPVLLS